MEFEKVITERYSVRKFKTTHLEKEVIDKILEDGAQKASYLARKKFG